jgi:CPA2 family monovalent cation:H+ antiporter-2
MPHETALIGTIAAGLGLAFVLGFAAARLGLPPLVGYLLAGVLVGPFTPGFVADREQLQLLADLGVVLLLFEVGIEVDVLRLRREHSALLWAAPLQVVVTTAVAAVVFVLLGIAPVGAAILGLCMAFSSSVVVVNITRSRQRTTDRRTEEALLGWSVLQDVTAVALAAVLLVLLGADSRPVEVALPLLLGFAFTSTSDRARDLIRLLWWWG